LLGVLLVRRAIAVIGMSLFLLGWFTIFVGVVCIYIVRRKKILTNMCDEYTIKYI
jgi:hypothetical protein